MCSSNKMAPGNHPALHKLFQLHVMDGVYFPPSFAAFYISLLVIQKFRQRLRLPNTNFKCMCQGNVCVSHREECAGSAQFILEYKQIIRASFNLIDSVLKNNTAEFGCNASKLTTMTFIWGGLQSCSS